jgi:DNA-binding GntR family transcriptional regulator
VSTPRDKNVPVPSKLQRRIATKIVEYIRDNGLRKGDPLTEHLLAEILQVSRTPVRAALKYLAAQDVVAPTGARRGYSVRAPATSIARLAKGSTPSAEDALYAKVTADYVQGELPEQLSEADMMRRYGINRGLLVRVLQRMSREGVIERNPGHGWRFAPLLRSGKGHEQSYRFRLAVEPAALLEPDFLLDRIWAARSRREHETMLNTPRHALSRSRFFDLNAEFHESLAACSGNQFFHHTIQHQNKLRRFLAFSWNYPLERIEASCREHLEILTALQSGEREWAATLMKRHLKLAAQVPLTSDAADDATAGD